ncbi:MAG TPA: hypothetical protein VGE07_14095 [Herpetosiphonaceae bacterium]
MARPSRPIPQKTLSPEDRAQFLRMIEEISGRVGVHLDQQPQRFPIDTRILSDLSRFPVRRATSSVIAWGTYYAYSPTYTALTPEQRWNYIAWLAGDENLGIQLFRQMRLYGLCAELGGPRRDEAIAAMQELYDRSVTDSVARTMIGNQLTLAYGAVWPERLGMFLAEFRPATVPLEVLMRCLARADVEASGFVLLEIALRCNFKLARGMNNRRPAIEVAMREIAERWGARVGTTAIRYVVDRTPAVPSMLGHNDSLLTQVARTLGLEQGSFAFDRSDAGVFMRGLAAAAQELVRTSRKGAPPLDGLELLDGMLTGNHTAVVQFDLSGAADYVMTPAEQREHEAKLELAAAQTGVRVVNQEWDVYNEWGERTAWSADSVLIRALPIKRPGSPQPWNAPTPPTFAGSSYKALTPEQRWWYLDWLAGEPVEPLEVFLAVRFKGLEAAYQHRAASLLLQEIEALFERSRDEALHRAALEVLMPAYADTCDSERASEVFNRIPISPDQVGRLLGHLWASGGQLDGRGLLYVARAGDFNHTPLTREHFDAIAARALELLEEWEEENGPISYLPVMMFGRARRRGTVSAVQVAAIIARQAQEDFKAERRAAPGASSAARRRNATAIGASPRSRACTPWAR